MYNPKDLRRNHILWSKSQSQRKMENNYVTAQQRKFEDYAESYRKESNEVFRELVRQLILADTVLLSISPFVFSGTSLIEKLSVFDKHILSLSWILFAISLMTGVIQLFKDQRFLIAWMKAKFSIVEGIALGRIREENMRQEVLDAQRGVPNKSSELFVILQSASLFLGLVFLVFEMVKFLFR